VGKDRRRVTYLISREKAKEMKERGANIQTQPGGEGEREGKVLEPIEMMIDREGEREGKSDWSVCYWYVCTRPVAFPLWFSFSSTPPLTTHPPLFISDSLQKNPWVSFSIDRTEEPSKKYCWEEKSGASFSLGGATQANIDTFNLCVQDISNTSYCWREG